MTPAEYEDYTLQYERMMTEIGKSLKDVLTGAKQENRVKYGVLQAAQAMEMPDQVMLCILTVDDIGDVTAHMYRTLMEAFCCENEIRVIKVNSANGVAKIFGSNKNNSNNINVRAKDFGFLLVEYPAGDLSVCEEDVLEFCDRTAFTSPQPVVALPA